MHTDVIIIGGSYAGLSAALQLARARRRITVVDAGQRRNRFASHSHGFLGRDGHSPSAIADEARQQLLAYSTVHWLAGEATQASQVAGGFEVVVNGQPLSASRLVLASGVTDELPEIEGLRERWGRSVFHCPYCHGYELNQGAIGVLANNAMAMHQAQLLPEWGQVTLLLNGAFVPDDEQQALLTRCGVKVEHAQVLRLEDHASVVLKDGRRLHFSGLFTVPSTRMTNDLPHQLGCALEHGPVGSYLRVNELKETSVPGVFACGDTARGFSNVAMAVGDGAMTGASVHRSLVFDH
ncbi:thioredoxin reductase [Hydrogenophaga palleronii]|uniref:Thioredoxin reductase n=1 Tax=Hydrogenophaga palleronii TaxID=65655 RepID=A0ABU1WUT1_9BURK|nr:NAD(P)/FAD-dependent oxidoreductase [Hydrogenophaga palleronii]MDR7153064.1 thioredoxin reductase [Hydrogenophaga palleronii]